MDGYSEADVYGNNKTWRQMRSGSIRTFFDSVNILQSYKQEGSCLMHFVHLVTTLLEDEESVQDNRQMFINLIFLPTDLAINLS